MWEGGVPPSLGREIFLFWGSESCNLVHSLVRFLAFYLVRIWIKIIPYSTHKEGSLDSIVRTPLVLRMPIDRASLLYYRVQLRRANFTLTWP